MPSLRPWSLHCQSAASRQPQASQFRAADPLTLLVAGSLNGQKRGLFLYHSLTFSDGLQKARGAEEEHMSPHTTTPTTLEVSPHISEPVSFPIR